MLLLPDTPRWYYARGRTQEADETVGLLLDAPVDDPRVQVMRESILASIALEESSRERGFRLVDLIWDRSDLRIGRRIRISFLILAIQQMMGKQASSFLEISYAKKRVGSNDFLQLSGINLSIYYSTVIFSQLGLSQFMSQLLSALMNTLFAAGSVPLIFTVERFGRRNILMYSAIALTVCLVIFIAMIGLPNPTDATQWTAVGAIFVYNFIFGYGWIGVPWLYGPEVRSQTGVRGGTFSF